MLRRRRTARMATNSKNDPPATCFSNDFKMFAFDLWDFQRKNPDRCKEDEIVTMPPASICSFWSKTSPRAARRAPRMIPTREATMKNITWKEISEYF